MNESIDCPRSGNKMEVEDVKLSEGIRWRTTDNRRGQLLRLGTAFLPRDYDERLCRKCQSVLISYQ